MKAIIKATLIAILLYVAGILVPLAAFIVAVQRDLVLAAWNTGNVLLLAGAVAVALTIGLGRWVWWLAKRV